MTSVQKPSKTTLLMKEMDLVKRVLGIDSRDPKSLDKDINVLGSLESLAAGASRTESLIISLNDTLMALDSRLASREKGEPSQLEGDRVELEQDLSASGLLVKENAELKSLLRKQIESKAKVEIRDPTPYDGARDSELLENFLYDMEETFEAKETLESRKLAVGKSYLTGHAKKWLRTKLEADRANGNPTITSWVELKEALKAQFFPQDTEWRARNKLMGLSQTTTIRDYIANFNALMSDLPDMNQKCRVYHFLRGLKAWAQNEIRRKGATTVQQAVQIAESLNDFKPDPPAQKASTPKAGESQNSGRKRKRSHQKKKSMGEVTFFSLFGCGG